MAGNCLVKILIILLLFSHLYSEEINENELFSNQDVVIENTKLMDNSEMNSLYTEKKSVNISGEINSVLINNVPKTWFDISDNSFITYMIGNLLFDIRLLKGFKGFANLEIQHSSQNGLSNVLLREFFVDFNIEKKIYVRTGKQVVQWSRCYLWNPTDFINVEKKTFVQKIGYREGAYGIKTHIPFGTNFNIYSFIDTGNISNADKIAGALKFEFLIGDTEMAISTWAKKGYRSLYGYDFSTRFLGFDIAGEASMSYGDNYERIRENNNELQRYRINDEWVPKASINLTKFFDFDNIKDRISVTAEFYYNNSGYSENILSDSKIYNFNSPVSVMDYSGVSTLKTTGTKGEFLYYNNLYEENNYAKTYTGLFINVNKFIHTDITLGVNLIGNLIDSSFMVSPSLTYKDINDFSLGLVFIMYIGKDNSGEYTFSKNSPVTRLFATIAF